MIKICPKCGHEWQCNYFCKHHKGKHLLSCYCLDCWLKYISVKQFDGKDVAKYDEKTGKWNYHHIAHGRKGIWGIKNILVHCYNEDEALIVAIEMLE